MNARLKMLSRNESGITALETAIILIAFVVVASVFAFTILSAGTFSTERGKEAIYAGLAEVRGTMTLKGSVLAGGVRARKYAISPLRCPMPRVGRRLTSPPSTIVARSPMS